MEVDKKIINFIGKTQDGHFFDLLKQAVENNIVLYFYPKDDTPGCTVEGIEFSELNKEFKKQNTLVFGMSRDNLDSHKRFCNKNNIHLPLLSDVEGEYGKKLGILKETGGFKRTTVLIGHDGKIKHIWENVKANGHAKEVLSKVTELENQAKKRELLGKDLGSTRRGYKKPAQKSASKSKTE